MDIKLLALDMDGTTYYRMGEIVESNIKPLQDALAQGIDIAIITGRPVLARQNKLIEHGIVSDKTVIVGFNGGCIYDLGTKTILSSNPIDSQTAKKVFELTRKPEFAGSIIFGYVDNLEQVIVSVEDPSPAAVDYPIYAAESEFFDGEWLTFDKVKQNFDYRFFKLLAFNAAPGFIAALNDLGLETATSNNLDAEVNAKGINKKFAVKWLSENWNVPIENIMSIGDGANDLPMIEYAGVGVAIKNSIQAIKDIAQIYIDLTNEQGAVGEVIKQYVLKK